MVPRRPVVRPRLRRALHLLRRGPGDGAADRRRLAAHGVPHRRRARPTSASCAGASADARRHYLDAYGEVPAAVPDDVEWAAVGREPITRRPRPGARPPRPRPASTSSAATSWPASPTRSPGRASCCASRSTSPARTSPSCGSRTARVGDLLVIRLTPYRETHERFYVFNRLTGAITRDDGLAGGVRTLPGRPGRGVPGRLPPGQRRGPHVRRRGGRHLDVPPPPRSPRTARTSSTPTTTRGPALPAVRLQPGHQDDGEPGRLRPATAGSPTARARAARGRRGQPRPLRRHLHVAVLRPRALRAAGRLRLLLRPRRQPRAGRGPRRVLRPGARRRAVGLQRGRVRGHHRAVPDAARHVRLVRRARGDRGRGAGPPARARPPGRSSTSSPRSPRPARRRTTRSSRPRPTSPRSGPTPASSCATPRRSSSGSPQGRVLLGRLGALAERPTSTPPRSRRCAPRPTDAPQRAGRAHPRVPDQGRRPAPAGRRDRRRRGRRRAGRHRRRGRRRGPAASTPSASGSSCSPRSSATSSRPTRRPRPAVLAALADLLARRNAATAAVDEPGRGAAHRRVGGRVRRRDGRAHPARAAAAAASAGRPRGRRRRPRRARRRVRDARRPLRRRRRVRRRPSPTSATRSTPRSPTRRDVLAAEPGGQGRPPRGDGSPGAGRGRRPGGPQRRPRRVRHVLRHRPAGGQGRPHRRRAARAGRGRPGRRARRRPRRRPGDGPPGRRRPRRPVRRRRQRPHRVAPLRRQHDAVRPPPRRRASTADSDGGSSCASPAPTSSIPCPPDDGRGASARRPRRSTRPRRRRCPGPCSSRSSCTRPAGPPPTPGPRRRAGSTTASSSASTTPTPPGCLEATAAVWRSPGLWVDGTVRAAGRRLAAGARRRRAPRPRPALSAVRPGAGGRGARGRARRRLVDELAAGHRRVGGGRGPPGDVDGAEAVAYLVDHGDRLGRLGRRRTRWRPGVTDVGRGVRGRPRRRASLGDLAALRRRRGAPPADGDVPLPEARLAEAALAVRHATGSGRRRWRPSCG